MGDSITFGEGVAFNETYLVRLEQMMYKTGNGCQEFINAGVPGYSIEQASLLMQRQIEIYQPDSVTLGWLPGAVYREKGRYIYYKGYIGVPFFTSAFESEGRLVLSEFSSPIHKTIDIWMQKHSLLYLFTKYRVVYGLAGKYIYGPSTYEPPTKENLQIAVARIEQMRDIAYSKGLKFTLLAFCTSTHEQELINEIMSNKNINFCTVNIRQTQPQNQTSGPTQKLTFEHDKHPNSKGHQLIAESAFQVLKQTEGN